MEPDIKSIKEAWGREADIFVIKAATKDFKDYPPDVQSVIEAEAKYRGFWEKVLFLRGEKPTEPLSESRNIVGYVCERCKKANLNFQTGRCSQCNLPSFDMGYCIICDKFYPILPGRKCPEHDKNLSRSKVPTNYVRFANNLIDNFLLDILFTLFIGLVLKNSTLSFYAVLIISLLFVFLYYFLFESVFQRTPAKFITGTKVINSMGQKPSLFSIAIRTLIRFIPFEPFSFFTGNYNGWHDRWSKTYVIKAKRL